MKNYNSKPSKYILSALCFTVLFFLAAGAQMLSENGNIVWTAGLFYRVLILSLVAGTALGLLLCRILILVGRMAQPAGEPAKPFPFTGLLSFLGMTLSWLPYYLAYYPGICAYDSGTQMEQFFTNASYNDHHPLLHTLLIKLCLDLGHAVSDSYNAGIGLYCLLQLLALAGACAYGIASVSRILAETGRAKASRLLPLILTLLFMLCPFNGYLAVSVTKDVPFTIFVMVMLTAFSNILFRNRAEWKWDRTDVIFLLSALGCIFMRNNGKYALLVPVFFLVCVLIRMRRDASRPLWGRLLILSVTALAAGTVVLFAVARLTSAQPADKREMLSLPIQQLARVMVYHGGIGVVPQDDNTLDQESKDLISEFLLDGSYANYTASISDPVKRHTNTSVVRYQPARFAKVYLGLMARYPGDYYNAFLGLYAGFLNPLDQTHASVNLLEGISGLGYAQTYWDEARMNSYGIYKESLWPAFYEMAEKWASANDHLRLPILKYLLMPGIWLWLYVALFLTALFTGKKKYLLPLAFIAGYYLTMLLGPTVQLRYIFPCMLMLPILAVYICRNSIS